MAPIDLRKNAKDTLRLTRDTFKGHELINLRVFYEDSGELKPGKQGVAFKVEMLPDVITALSTLLESPPTE